MTHPNLGGSINGCFTLETPDKIDDLGAIYGGTPILGNVPTGSERSVLVQYVSASLHYVIPIPEGLPTVFATAMPRLRAPSGAQAAAADPCSPARSPHLASGDLPCGLRQQQSISA